TKAARPTPRWTLRAPPTWPPCQLPTPAASASGPDLNHRLHRPKGTLYHGTDPVQLPGDAGHRWGDARPSGCTDRHGWDRSIRAGGAGFCLARPDRHDLPGLAAAVEPGAGRDHAGPAGHGPGA